jgi:hypothetical protein
MREDFAQGIKFMNRLRPTQFLLGNHDVRLWKLAELAKGLVSDYAKEGVSQIESNLKKLKCHLFPYDARHGIFKLGHLKILHGYACGVGAVRKHAMTYQSCMFGHTHSCGTAPVPGLERRVARNIGCLCDLDQDYEATKMSKLEHSRGFAYGIINEKTGNYQVLQAEEIDGSWIVPTDFKTF